MTVMGHQSFFETEKSPQTRMNTKKNVPDSKIRHIIWWGKVDSNHRSVKQQIYSLSPLATREFPHIFCLNGVGAGRRIRTPDLLITNQLLYRLSYTGTSQAERVYYSQAGDGCQAFFSVFGENICTAHALAG